MTNTSADGLHRRVALAVANDSCNMQATTRQQ